MVVAVIYSAVGHAGASGYSAVMALFSISPALMRPTSLMLNIVVGSIGLYRFYKAGLVNLRVVAPFLIVSMPAAYWASQLEIEKQYFYLALGVVLLVTGTQFMFNRYFSGNFIEVRRAPLLISFFAGGLIGFLSGITGTGGAIFFTPLLLKMKWADPRHAAGLSVVFVLANSMIALVGIFKISAFFDLRLTTVWIIAVVIGAILGTHLGILKFSNVKIQKILGIVLIIAAIKLLVTAIQKFK
ncbi:MAG: sulfite exporter TauE/SafE family protein [Oligoflexia bacterium]|nr:sulfite exporter TauE/SafE family protein [Oligoflexia bacterium]